MLLFSQVYVAIWSLPHAGCCLNENICKKNDSILYNWKETVTEEKKLQHFYWFESIAIAIAIEIEIEIDRYLFIDIFYEKNNTTKPWPITTIVIREKKRTVAKDINFSKKCEIAGKKVRRQSF